uniref:Mucin 6, oligomeric mucus/gel-forming n=1 Tax=Otolemur garnettii TaxID=30611 RepID=H0WT19_OTOGA
MLRLLLLLSNGGALLSTGLDNTFFARPGLWKSEDSPQIDPDKGWCSTWGTGHFSTFDHHVYDFLGTCNYVFTATCKDASPTFSVQLRRGLDGNISRIIMELGASVITVSKATISVKDIGVISLPHTSNGLQITPFGQSVRLVAKQLELELEVLWSPDAHLTVLVERKYMGRMCGLCGNFDGKTANEFLSEEGKLLEPHKYAALQKLDDPNEICAYEAVPRPPVWQTKHAQICTQLLALVSPECNVPKSPFVLSCQADMATATQPGQQDSKCATLSEYSRQCSMAGQPVRSWRRPGLCAVGPCPAGQVYQECGSACVRTCSNPQHHCSSFCTFGCFCPEGTVLNDLSTNHTCVPVTQCPCVLNGAIYAPGDITTTACRTCQCTSARWTCTEHPCPGHCSLEGGSFVTTFDARPYRFHGSCTYILLQSPQLPDEGTLMAVYDKSGYSHSETSLAAVIYLSKQVKIVISQDGVITNNEDPKWLPYQIRNITVFRQTSTHLQMATTFGLELVIQLQPIFQVYVTVGSKFRGHTRGLCGNFNGDTTDDFMTSVGIAEGTASLFVDSWRAGNCPAALERETDPCSMSQLNKVCAETHCSVLLRKGTVFERCHATVNPAPFYKRCVYEACNYEETFPHICATLGSYAHACSSQGILLWGWRSSVDNCTIPCSGNRTFSYDSRACGRTCLSLSDRAVECQPSAVPVDGCNCPEGTYLNHRGECVRRAQCPCVLEGGRLIPAGQSTVIDSVACHCTGGRLSCPGRPQMFFASCSALKTFQSCSQSSENKFGAACAPTCQLLATGTPCVPTKCEPGCVCAEGLYENASGQCVPPEECPCEFAGTSYPGGAKLHTDCRTCTCSRGKWTCQQSLHCPSTCALYGEGHVVTFDGQRFVFDGNCEYILATDGCGTNDSQPTFKILTENVICGRSGVTCSRAIKIFSGGLSIVLADSNYTVTGEDPRVHLRVKPSSLNLILDISIPGRYSLTLIWNKHMTIFIKIDRASQDPLCGLCGNYNGNMKDDFETRSKYVAANELEFVNSWKESPLCGDVSFLAEPCSLNAFRRSWAERKCSIINSQTFAACHSKVYHLPYYEACVRDACGCDTGGDCECLCDTVAAYAKACLDKGVCVDWRTPAFCPIYCDFYNTHTQVGGSGELQHTQEANCTWHYQPCLCPGQPESLLDTNIEGCYNCSQDEYFDHKRGSCVPCVPPTTPWPPTTGHMPHPGSPPTEVQPTTVTHSTIGHRSTPEPWPSPTQTPQLLTTRPSGLSTKSTVSSSSMEESPRTTTVVTPRTTVPAPTATRPTMTQANTQPTASSLSPATKLTAQSTVWTTVPPETSAVSGTSPRIAESTNQASTGPTANQTPDNTGPATTSKTTRGITTHPGQTSPPETWTQTSQTLTTSTATTSPHPHTTHTPSTGSLPSTTHTRGPPTEMSFKTTSITPSAPNHHTTLPAHVPSSSTSLVTQTAHQGSTTTHSEIPTTSMPKSTPTRRPTTTVKETGSTSPFTVTNQPMSPFTTAKTSSSQHSQTASTSHHQPTASNATTITPRLTTSDTGPTMVKSTTSANNRPHTPLMTNSPSTGSLPHTPHTTRPPSGTSFKTSSTAPTPTRPHTILSTYIPSSSTSLVTQTAHQGSTPTHSEIPTSNSTLTSTSTRLPITTLKATGSTSPFTTTSLSSSPFSTAKTSSQHSQTASTSHHQPTTSTATTITPNFTTSATGPATGSTSPFTGTSQPQSPFTTAKTSSSQHSQTASTSHHQSTATYATTITAELTTITPKLTTSDNGPTMLQSTTPTNSLPHTPHTTHSPSTGSLPSIPHTTGPPFGTSFKTTSSTVLTPPHPHTTLSTHVPSSSTSLVTQTAHLGSTTTHSEIPTSNSTLTSIPTRLPITTLKATGSTAPLTGTSQPQSPFTTAKISSSQHSQTASTSHHQTTATHATTITPKLTTITPKLTTSDNGPTMFQSTTLTNSLPHTPHTTHSPSTGALPSTPHTTGPPSGTSFKTTSTAPTPPHPHTTLPTHVPSSSTSLVTQTAHQASTQTHHSEISTSTSRPTATATRLPTTTPRATVSTSPFTMTSQGISPFTTDKTSSSLISLSSPSLTQNSSSTPPFSLSVTPHSPNPSSVTTIFSPTNSLLPSPHLPSTTSPSSLSPSSASAHGSSSQASTWTSSIHSFTSLTASSTPVHSFTLSSGSPTPFSTLPLTTVMSTSAFPSFTLPHSTLSFTPSAQSSTPPLPLFPTESHLPAHSTSVSSSTLRTTAHTPTPAISSQATTRHFTAFTTQVPHPSSLSSTSGLTATPSSPATSFTTRHPDNTLLPTSIFPSSSFSPHGSTAASAASSSSLVTTPPYSTPGACSVREWQEEITFKGCTANVTMTRCEGACASSTSFNIDTQQVDTHCGCCHPLSFYEQQLELPCSDSSVPGQRLMLTLQVFNSCACSPRGCRA